MAIKDIIIRNMAPIMALSPKLHPLVVPAALAVLLALVSIPSVIANAISTPFRGDVERIRHGDHMLPIELAAVARANYRAALFFEPGRHYSDSAAALLALPEGDRSAVGLDAEEIVRKALAASPASPYNWNRLAYLRARRGDRVGAYSAWEMSVLTGRYVPRLMKARLLLAFQMFPIKDRVMLRMLDDQVRLTAQALPRELGYAAYTSGSEFYTRAVLWHDADLLSAYEIGYRDARWIDITKAE